MATNSTKQKKSSAANSSNKTTAEEARMFYEKYKNRIDSFESAKGALGLLDPSKNYSKTFSTFSKEKLRTYMKNPLAQYKNLRSLSRYLWYRSQLYRKIITFNANLIDLNYRSVIPIIDIVKGGDKTKVLKSYNDTLITLENMNLPLEFLKAYIVCWREDVFFGCAYHDDTGFFILPLDPDYCKVTGIYPTGDLSFHMDMSYFSRRQEILEMWGEPFESMYKEYQKDQTNGKWQPMPDENCVCLKVNFDDWETPLPPYIGLFNSLINLEDLAEITAIADEQQIYKLLVATIPLLKNSNEVNDFAIDVDLVIDFYKKIVDALPEYTDAILSLTPIDTVSFDNDQASDVNKIENATKSILTNSGGLAVLGSDITGSTAWLGSIRADEDYAMSSLLPQTQSIVNRLLSYYVKNPARVKFMEVSKFTVEEFKNTILKDCTYGLPDKLLLNNLNGFTELETLSMNFLEEECLGLSQKFVPLQSSNTQNTGNIANPEGGRPSSEENGESVSSEAEDSRDKRDRNE